MGLLDRFRRAAPTPVTPATSLVPAPTLGEVATTANGRDITRGYIDSLATLEPLESILQLRNSADFRVHEEILRDDQVKAVLEQRRFAVVSRELVVEPGGDAPVDVAAADDLREQLKRIQFDRVSNKMLYAQFYGFSVGECLYSIDGARVRLDGIKVRRQRRFGWAPNGELRLKTSARPTGEAVPPRKFWTVESGGESDDDPYGLGLVHWLYWPAFFKRHGLKYWMIFLEKFGMPTAVGEYPPGAGPEERKKLLAAVGAITTDSGIILPQGMLVKLLEAARSGTADYATLVDKMNAAISKVVVGQTMTTDPGSSEAQANVHYDVQQAVAKSDADELCASFQAGPATWLTEWNFPGAKVPTLYRNFPDKGSLKVQAETEQIVSNTTGLRPTKRYVQETYGGEWEEKPAGAMLPPAFAELDRKDAPARISDELARSAGGVVGPWIERLRQLAEDTNDLTELRDRVLDVYDELDPANLGDVLEQGLTLAELRGRSEAGRG